MFQKKEHSVNYLESHDGYTLGDFIRLALGDVTKGQRINDINKYLKLTPLQLKLNKLAALFLFVCQGIVMIHSGQEFARSKVISRNTKAKDINIGMLDHNSYEKDNETNYINFEHAKINEDLLSYYKGLINFRNTFEAFRRADYEDINFYEDPHEPFLLGFEILSNQERFIVILNANHKKEFKINLPEGNWVILVNEEFAGTNRLEEVKGELKVNPVAGYVLRKV